MTPIIDVHTHCATRPRDDRFGVAGALRVGAQGHTGRHRRRPQHRGGCGLDTSASPALASMPPREQQTPEGLRAFHAAEIEKWRPIIEAANIKPE